MSEFAGPNLFAITWYEPSRAIDSRRPGAKLKKYWCETNTHTCVVVIQLRDSGQQDTLRGAL